MLAFPSLSALVFLPFVLPIAIWVAWSDLKSMKIPNKAVIALGAVFLILGPFLLPLPVWAWQLVHVAVVLVVGFLLSSVGALGAGDAKFATAMAPFVLWGDVSFFLLLLAATTAAAIATHRILRGVAAFRRLTPDWESWERRKDFPMGFPLAGALVFYLALAAFG